MWVDYRVYYSVLYTVYWCVSRQSHEQVFWSLYIGSLASLLVCLLDKGMRKYIGVSLERGMSKSTGMSPIKMYAIVTMSVFTEGRQQVFRR